MSNDDKTWLTAGEAARILHMSERQVNRYGSGSDARLQTSRAGRRVLYLASDVYDLANELRVDIRPAPQRSTAMIPPEMVRHMQEQAEQMRQQGETQASIDRRLAEIESQLSKPQVVEIPRWLTILVIVLVVLVILGIVLPFFR
jgi:hypothetical protein